MSSDARISAVIRSFQPRDQAACKMLYVDGLIGGSIADNDTGCDIDHIHDVYVKCAGNHFWVAESPSGQVVGMIGVQHYDDGVGQIRRLRILRDHQLQGIGAALLETAVQFCKEKHYLKLMLDTFVERAAAYQVFEKFGFRLDRTRSIGEKELAYFYLDLYANEGRLASERGASGELDGPSSTGPR